MAETKLEQARAAVRERLIQFPGALPVGALAAVEQAIREDEREQILGEHSSIVFMSTEATNAGVVVTVNRDAGGPLVSITMKMEGETK